MRFKQDIVNVEFLEDGRQRKAGNTASGNDNFEPFAFGHGRLGFGLRADYGRAKRCQSFTTLRAEPRDPKRRAEI